MFRKITFALGAPAPSDPLASEAWRGPLTQVLATRIGPIAPIIVNREAAAVATLVELIERLAETIPLRERAEFRIEVTRLLPQWNPSSLAACRT
jgi:hypothetical protein